MLDEKEVYVLTSLESYYPERPKPNPKDKKGQKEFATNIDQPKDPKAIKVKATFDRAANDIIKELKSKLRVLSNHRGALTSRGRQSFATNVGATGFLSARGSTNESMRRMTAVSTPSQASSSANIHAQQSEDTHKDELRLYLFKTKSKNKMLAFKRLENAEFPLRMLTKSTSEQGYVHIQTSATLVKQ